MLSHGGSAFDTLSARQAEIAALVARGKTNREIALALGLSIRTVETHLLALFNKVNVSTRGELTAALYLRSAGPDAEPAPAKRSNLPASRAALLGREGTIAEIERLVARERLVTLVGAGGVGKTRTALAAGQTLLNGSPDGVWLIELAPLVRGSYVAPAVARALGIKEPAEALLEALVAYLRGKSLLLVLDNCEHVIGEAAHLAAELLGGCPALRILATSREPLRIAGEHTYRLPPLPVPAAGEAPFPAAEAAAAYPAIALFALRASAVNRNFRLTDENVVEVAGICRRLDGIPLAIELAAARISVLSVRTLAALLDERFRILTSGDRTTLARHQTMRALIDWSYDLLATPERQLFERLSVFAGGFALAQVAAVCIDDAGGSDAIEALTMLSSLVDKSLVTADVVTPEPRYRLLESARYYATEKLAARGETESISRRHAAAYADLAERLDREYDFAADGVWDAAAIPEMENFRSALDWALVRGMDAVLGQRLAGALRPLWLAYSLAEGRRWLQAAFAFVDERTPPELVANLEFATAHLDYCSFEFEPALERSHRASELFAQCGNAVGEARAAQVLGGALAGAGRDARRLAEGKAQLVRAVESARRIGNQRVIATALLDLAMAQSHNSTTADDYAAAREYALEALQVWHAMGHERHVVQTMLTLADIEAQSGNAWRAFELAKPLLPKARESGVPMAIMTITYALAEYAIACDRWHDARTYVGAILRLAREQQHTMFFVWSMQQCAALAVLDRDAAGEEQHRVPAAAQLIGYVDAHIAISTYEATKQQEHERILTALRATLEASEMSALMRRGAELSADAAAALAFALLPAPSA
jgi:predicted ATPase/DNA-binding CsgD family transcriptional regulator